MECTPKSAPKRMQDGRVVQAGPRDSGGHEQRLPEPEDKGSPSLPLQAGAGTQSSVGMERAVPPQPEVPGGRTRCDSRCVPVSPCFGVGTTRPRACKTLTAHAGAAGGRRASSQQRPVPVQSPLPPSLLWWHHIGTVQRWECADRGVGMQPSIPRAGWIHPGWTYGQRKAQNAPSTTSTQQQRADTSAGRDAVGGIPASPNLLYANPNTC